MILKINLILLLLILATIRTGDLILENLSVFIEKIVEDLSSDETKGKIKSTQTWDTSNIKNWYADIFDETKGKIKSTQTRDTSNINVLK